VKRRGFVAVAGLLALGAASCGDPNRPKTFSSDWRDDQGKTIGEVLTRVRGAKPPPSTDLVVSVAGRDKIIGTPLGAGSPWTATHALDGRPIIAGNVVVVSGNGEVVALDAASGKAIWTRPTGNVPLLGAGDDGNLTALTLSRSSGGSTLLMVGRDGTVVRQLETEKALGAPAVLGGLVFVPWAGQYVSALDPQSNEEIGRVTVREKVTRAFVVGGTLYFGDVSYVRFDDNIVRASAGQASKVGVPSRELPGTPRLLVPGTEKIPAVANARDRDRLFGRPDGASNPFGVDSNRFYADYYKLVFGFDAARGQLSWVRTHPDEVIGGEAVAGGLLTCDAQGKLTVFDALNGATTMEKSVGEPIASCTVQADTFRSPKGAPSAAPVAKQIIEAVQLREPTLATAQRLLLRELATLEDESATKTLVEIATDPRSAPVLAADARASLATRRNGASYMLTALGKHYDFLHDVLMSPPVGPMSDALAAMKEAKAAPLLASHLFDPADTEDDVKRASAALAVLATDKELPQCKQFFGMYRGTASTEDMASAVASVAEAMLRLDAKGSRPILEAALKDSNTALPVHARLDTLLAAANKDKDNKDKPDGGT
jgi:outer membrane protein assembly factor BamB